MSWDVYLTHGGETTLKVPLHQEGGTYALGGTNAAELNITYNYSPYYYTHLDEEKGLRWLDGQIAKDTIDRLQSAVEELGVVRDSDYWRQSPGNAGYALNILLSWARLHPEGVWIVN